MFKILHAHHDYPYCSFEFLNLDTQEHIFASFFDDPFYEILKECGVNYAHELERKVIKAIPVDLFIHTKEYAVIRAQQYLEGSWFFPWLRKKQNVKVK